MRHGLRNVCKRKGSRHQNAVRSGMRAYARIDVASIRRARIAHVADQVKPRPRNALCKDRERIKNNVEVLVGR